MLVSMRTFHKLLAVPLVDASPMNIVEDKVTSNFMTANSTATFVGNGDAVKMIIKVEEVLRRLKKPVRVASSENIPAVT